MNMQIIGTFLFVGFLFSCNSKWENIKKTQNVYPKDSISSYNIYALDHIERKWVNEAYRNYEYKKYCGNSVEATFEMSNSMVSMELWKDTFKIAKLLQNDFRARGICHFVGQTLSQGELKIYLYNEDGLNPIGTLLNFRIPNVGIMKDDLDWKFYSTFLLKN